MSTQLAFSRTHTSPCQHSRQNDHRIVVADCFCPLLATARAHAIVHAAHWLLLGTLIIAIPLAVVYLSSVTAQAAGIWFVTPSGNDAFDCLTTLTPCATINGALGKPIFASGDTIRVAAGQYTGTGEEVVLLNKGAVLSGGWNASFTYQNGISTIDGQNARRGMTVQGNLTAALENFVLQNGRAISVGGGGIYNNGSTLTLNDTSVISNTSTVGFGGGIHNAVGTIVVSKSAVRYNYSNAGGGGVYNSAVMTITETTISNNSSGIVGGSGGLGGGGITNDHGATMRIDASTISGNWVLSDYYGSGIWNAGSVALNSTTVSGNHSWRAGDGEAIANFQAIAFRNSTIAYNSGIGLRFYDGTATFKNTIMANNLGPWDCINWHGFPGGIQSLGYNLIGVSVDCNLASTDISTSDAKLDVLRDNGGPTTTHALLPGSPAFNAGDPSGCTDSTGVPLSLDQREFPRTGRCDIGAYEVQPLDFATITADPPVAARGSTIMVTINLGNSGTSLQSGVHVTNTLPSSLSYVDGSLEMSGGSGTFQGADIVWSGDLGTGQSATISFRATINDLATFGAVMKNSVLIDDGTTIIPRTSTIGVDYEVCDFAKLGSNPVLSPGPLDSWDSDGVYKPFVLKQGNEFKMWYTGRDGNEVRRIGYATSPDGVHWTKYLGNPVFAPTSSYGSVPVSDPHVIQDNGIYKMWYSEHVFGDPIGMVISSDGITWSVPPRYSGLGPGDLWSWDDTSLSSPTVQKLGDEYGLWYAGNDGSVNRVGHAFSYDSMVWTKQPGSPVLNVGGPGSWDWLHAYAPSILPVEASYLLLYSGETLPTAGQTGYAVSFDGIAWTKKGQIIPMGAGGAFDATSADYASAIANGPNLAVWYSGANAEGAYSIGYGTAELCDGAPTVPPSSSPPSNAVYLPFITNRGWCPPYYTESFANPTSGWPIREDQLSKFGYVDGEYEIWAKSIDRGLSASAGASATDFGALVTARRSSGSYGSYGIVFSINDDWTEFHEFLVGSSSYSLWRYRNSTWTALQGWTPSDAILSGKGSNRMKLIRNGATIQLFVNNQFLKSLTDASFADQRRIGLVVNSSTASPLDVRFDNFELYPGNCASIVRSDSKGGTFQIRKPEIHSLPQPPRQPE